MFFCWTGRAQAQSTAPDASSAPQGSEPTSASDTNRDAGVVPAPAGDAAPAEPDGGVQPIIEPAPAVEAQAQPELPAPEVADDDGSLEVMVVTGSRSERTRVESLVPVDVVTGEALTQSGQTETARALATLAPSFNSAPQTIADGSDHVAPASLRGLGPDQVLVLINGKRRHKSSLVHVNGTFGRGSVGTDLNAIPPSAIKRIEILRDGAATQYGTDAIAGVINIVLKDQTDTLDLTSSTGITGKGDGAQLRAATNGGVKLGEKGFLNISAEFLQRGATNRSGTYTGTVFTDDRAMDDAMLAMRGLSRADFNMKIGESAATVGLVFYNMELPLGEHTTLYSFGGVTHRDGIAAGFYRFPKQTNSVVPEFYPDGFLPEIHSHIDDLAMTAGVRTRRQGWDVDLSLSHGQNQFQFNVEHSNNASLGPRSPTSFDAGRLSAAETTLDLDLLREIDTGFLERLAFVAGSEFRLERYRIGAGDPASYELGDVMGKLPGAQVFPGFTPDNAVDRSRNNIGAYAGIESALTRVVSLDLGARFERYSDFGFGVIGKGAARVQVWRGIALRGALSSGFRAPSLQQLWFNNVSTQFVVNPATNMQESTQVLTSNNQSPVTRAFGIPQLKQETAVNASLGFAFQPLPTLSVTVDAYQIHVDDRVVLTSRFANTDATVADILSPFPSVSQAQFFANAVDTRTRGIDLVADYTVHFQPHTLIVTFAGNLSYTDVVRVNLPQELLDRATSADSTLQNSFFGRQERGRLESSVPKMRFTTGLRYKWQALSALLRANYFGPVDFKADNPDNDEHFGWKMLFDLEVSYRFHPAFALAIGADNVFNTFPDRQKKDANINAGRLIYSRNVMQFGQNGGFYYARMQLSWL